MKSTTPLANAQVLQFREQGYLLLENELSDKTISDIAGDFSKWVEESREYTEAYAAQPMQLPPSRNPFPVYTAEALRVQ